MTTICPIIKQCIKQLKLEPYRELLTDFDLEEIQDRSERCIAAVEYTRLRGFMLIEEMLTAVKTIYETEYKTESSPNLVLQLPLRSWSGLTTVKESLKELVNDVELELGEAQLQGNQIDAEFGFSVVCKPSPDDTETWSARSNRIRAALLMRGFLPVINNAIRAFRPFLSNPDASISIVVDSTARVLREVYGDASGGDYLLRVTNRLMDAQL